MPFRTRIQVVQVVSSELKSFLMKFSSEMFDIHIYIYINTLGYKISINNFPKNLIEVLMVFNIVLIISNFY